MPYHIGKSTECPSSKPYAVIKDNDGRVMGCHLSRQNAADQIAALEISERKEEKAARKRENGIDYPARDFAFVPDPLAPSTWKLRLTETPGKVTAAQLGRAAAALSPGGFRGNRVQIPDTALASVKRRIRAEYRRLGVPEGQIPNTVKEVSGQFSVWKQANGSYRWLAAYSNNFRDNDFPPEIIAEESHRTFVKMVDQGIIDYPELWLWHIPGSRWGKADFVDYVDGIAIATGTVDHGQEKTAEALAQMQDIAVSHGMPSAIIMRDGEDNSVIRRHITTEISPLPRRAAANKLTDFVMLTPREVVDMPFEKDKRDFLRDLGFDEDRISALEHYAASMSKSATEAGIESKEESEAEVPVLDAQTEEPEEAAVPVEKESVAEEETVEAPAYVTREEVADAIVGSFSGVIDAIRALESRLDAAESAVKALKRQDEEKIAEMKEVTPTLSLRELVAKGLMGKSTAIPEGDPLLEQKPKEAAAASVTGIPFLDSLVAQTRK